MSMEYLSIIYMSFSISFVSVLQFSVYRSFAFLVMFILKYFIPFEAILFYFLTLQYCIGFAIYQHESATGIHMFPILNPLPTPSPYHPSGSSQYTNPKHPASCMEPGLAIHFIYDIIHVSMTFSQIIPPYPSPTEYKRLFYTSVTLLLSHIQGNRYHLSKFHICVNILYGCFSF